MKKLLFLLLVCSIFPLWSMDIFVTFKNGDVQVIDETGNKIPIQLYSKIPRTSIIQTGAKGKLELKINEKTYIFRNNLTIKLSDAFSQKGTPLVDSNSVALVRGLYHETYNQMLQDSQTEFSTYQSKHVVDYNGWKAPIENSFKKLISKSGKPSFDWKYAVVQDNSFNAGAFPGGQFLIHTGTLDELDKQIQKQFENIIDNIKKQQFRENFIAGVLAHELAHYYNQHTFNQAKRIVQSSQSGQNRETVFELKNIRYAQEDELDADGTGFLYLQKAGYDTVWFVKVLKLMNELSQNSQRQAIYFASHPSPHERLSKFPNEDQKLHEFAFQMEKTFSDIQLGTNLDSALEFLDKNLNDKWKNHLELKKARAICLHKKWLNSASLKDLTLRSIIDMPLFKDDMLFKKKDTSKGLEIIGDKKLYYQTKAAYHEVISSVNDIYFLSNYTTFIAYSDQIVERKKALLISEILLDASPNIQTVSNHGLVIFQNQNKMDALKFYRNMKLNYDLVQSLKYKSLEDIRQGGSIFDENFEKQLLLKMHYDKRYVFEDFTPILNLALLEKNFGDKETGEKIATFYYYYLDNNSIWAKSLKSMYAIPSSDLEKSNVQLSFQDISIGTKRDELFKRWGNPDLVSTNQKTLYFMKTRAQVELENDVVIQIYLRSPLSTKLNLPFGIGSTRAEVIKQLGKKYRLKGNYTIFQLRQSIAIKFEDDIVQEIVLFR